MTALHENIRKFRELRRLTQQQFADKLSKSRNVISNWERGANSPDPDTIEQICKILEVTPNQIFGWEPCPDYETYAKKIEGLKNKLNAVQKRKKEIDDEIMKIRELIKNESFTE